MGKINVLHVYQNSKTGGIQQQIRNLMASYDRSLINPAFCCLGPRREIADEIAQLGVDVFTLDLTRKHRFHPSAIIKLSRILKERNIHVLRTHKYRSNFYGRMAALLARTPVVIASEHNIYIDKELRLGRRTANRLLARRTDRMVAVSEPIRQDVVRYDRVPEDKTLVIHNGTELDRFTGNLRGAEVRKELDISEGVPLLGFVGRLVPSKGLEYLLEAMPSILKGHPQARLVLIGDGMLMEPLQGKAKQLGIDQSVVFTGNRRDIPDLLDAMDIFVLPSIKEGLPNSIIEAMASGKPIVSTEVGGVPELIEDGVTGLMVPPRNPSLLSEAINSLLSDTSRAQKLATAAREKAYASLSIEATARRWERLYTDLLTAKGVRPQ